MVTVYVAEETKYILMDVRKWS